MLTTLFVALISVQLAVVLWLNFRQINALKQSYNTVPEDFSQSISLDKHQKAADYGIAKLKFSNLSFIFSTIFLFIWLFSGVLDYIYSVVSFTDNAILNGIFFVVCFIFITSLIEMPWSFYKNFKIEQDFGFNKMSKKMFFLDNIKEFFIGAILISILLGIVLFIIENLSNWWFYVWLATITFSLFISWLYPTIISPIFNKFVKLDNKDLVEKIKNLLTNTGFKSSGIYVMDGSTRSGHGNAYFTGFGNKKRIVFFDTLLESMNDDEIESILAHELGHFHHKHIYKSMIMSSVIVALALFILQFLMSAPIFYDTFAIEQNNIVLALVIFSLIMPIFSFFITPLTKSVSRKFEYEADEFAISNSSGEHLISALVKLYKENYVSLISDKVYSFFYDTHPSARLRINHIKNQLSS